MRLATAAADLLLGARCPGCDQPAVAVCPACWSRLEPAPRLVTGHAVTTVASGEHVDELRRVIVAWKEENRSAMLPVLAHLLAGAVGALPLGRAVTLVPVPASARSRRARGADLVDDLARSAADLLLPLGLDVVVRQALRPVRRTADQSGLGAEERSRNLVGAFGLRSARDLRRRDVVVVDDVVTTGATLGESVRALRAAGHHPVAAAVVAVRPLGA